MGMGPPPGPHQENHETMKELKAYNLSAQLFDYLLETYNDQIKIVDNFSKYVHGYRYKNTFIYNGFNQLIILENHLHTMCYNKRWVQCICYRREMQKEDIIQTYSGGVAYNIMKKKIMKCCNFKNEDEFAERMSKFSSEYDENLNQLHYEWHRKQNTIYKYENCRKYDINGAYAHALITIFPEAKNTILKLYKDRKIKPQNKDLINFFVGMFAHKDTNTGIAKYKGTYNWIVQKTRKQINTAIEECNGILLYANTDGFAITDFKNELNTSKELGCFKLEYSGDIYTYSGENYWIMQTANDNKIVGNALYQVRPYIDLAKNIVVKYDRVTLTNLNNIVKAENVEIMEIKKY